MLWTQDSDMKELKFTLRESKSGESQPLKVLKPREMADSSSIWVGVDDLAGLHERDIEGKGQWLWKCGS